MTTVYTDAQAIALVNATNASSRVKAGMDSIITKAFVDGDAQTISQQGSGSGSQLQDFCVGVFAGQYVSVDAVLAPSQGWPPGGTGSQAYENAEMINSGVAYGYAEASNLISGEIWGATFPGSNGYPGGGAFAQNLGGYALETVYGQYLTAQISVGAA